MASNRAARHSTSQSPQRKTTAANDRDAIDLLTAQHREVEDLFKQFEKLGKDGALEKKEPIVRTACEKLAVHAAIEEQIFYPAARAVDEVQALLDESEVEHATATDLIATLDSMGVDDDLFLATFTVLSEYIRHHIKEEEGDLFPKLRKCGMKLDELGQDMAVLADELMEAQAEM